MSQKKRYKAHAEKREAGGYVPMPHVVLRSEEYARLSPFAVKLLNDLLAQYRGDNNGDLCAAWTLMQKRTWRSRDSLAKALNELRTTGFLVLTRQGGRHTASLYAVSFYEIDFCSGKLDLQTPNRSYMGSWRKTMPTVNNTAIVTPLKPQRSVISLTRRSCQSTENQHADRVNSAATA